MPGSLASNRPRATGFGRYRPLGGEVAVSHVLAQGPAHERFK